METIIKNLTEKIKEQIIADFERNDARAIELVLNAYNLYQEDERDGVDYIFNINKNDDLICCIKGGLTAYDITWLYDETAQGATPLFLFGVNYERPKHIMDWENAKNILLGVIDDVLLHMIVYQDVSGYKELYNHYVSDYFLEKDLLNR